MKIYITFILFLLSCRMAVAQNNSAFLQLLLRQLKKEQKQDTARISILIKIAGFYADSTTDFRKDAVDRYLTEAENLNVIFHLTGYQDRINIIGALSCCRSNPKIDAKKLFLPLIAVCKRTGDTGSEWLAWKYMADFTPSASKTDRFRLDCYRNALNLVKGFHNPDAEGDMLGKLAEIHFRQHDLTSVETELSQTIRLVDDNGASFSPLGKTRCNQSIGKLYLLKKQPVFARPYLLKSLEGFEAAGAVRDIRAVSRLLFQADSAAGNYQGAIANLEGREKIKDSIFQSVKSRQIEALNATYHIRQKDKDYKALKISAAFEQLALMQTESERTRIIIGSVMLLLIAGLLYRQAKITIKTNKLIYDKNEMLEQLVKEKEWLLKEVHHRVKNNLHTVISLLESQARYLEDDALKAIESSQHRIFAMSLIHQKLYRTEQIKTIEMAEYIPELVNNLGASFGICESVRFTFEIAPITLTISYAIPLGLIINEAVTNAIKYAFPQHTHSKIHVALTQDNLELKLFISDNGVGLKSDPSRTEYNSLGIELMKGLSEEINGHISFETRGGTRITVIFIPTLQL